jgi:hypothetical protein
MLRAFAAVLAALLSIASFAACGGDDFSSDGEEPSTPCNENPWSCAPGQTCWPNADGNAFACLNGAVGMGEGADCDLYPGTVTCGPGLFCTQEYCRRFCDPEDPNRGCPDGQICLISTIRNVDGTADIGDVAVCAYPPA